jgi:RecB family exonuclease
MLPPSFSATAIQVAEACPARYKAESVDKAPSITNSAAGLGTAVHNTLERGIKIFMETGNPPTEKDFQDFFYLEYLSVFGTVDEVGEDFLDGKKMIFDWYYRQDFDTLKVISAEVKENFPIPFIYNGEEITRPFNFIWDRHDRLGEEEYKVVDYKTNRWPVSPQDLKKKVQARAYGLAAQIKYPNAKRIWVEFDMLRHGGPVGIAFTRDDNIATWKYLKKKAQEVADMDENNLEERLNPECNFCIRKASCGALQRNIAAGGIMAVTTAAEMVELRTVLEFQRKGATSAITELDKMILAAAKESDIFEFPAGRSMVKITTSSRRAVDADMVELAIGADLFLKYGGRTITMAAIDKLLKGDALTDQQKSALRGLIYSKVGEPSVKVETVNPIDEDN